MFVRYHENVIGFEKHCMMPGGVDLGCGYLTLCPMVDSHWEEASSFPSFCSDDANNPFMTDMSKNAFGLQTNGGMHSFP